MRRIYTLLFATIVLVANTVMAQGLNEKDRAAALKYLSQTSAKLKKSVAGLSDAQLNFKASPESWSIAECVEHILIVENALIGAVEATLKQDADPSRRSEVQKSDEEIWELITNRSSKVKTQEQFVPSGKYDTFKATLKAFNERRAQTVNLVKTSKGDFRNHYFPFPFGTTDLHQVVVFVAGHCDRHTQQIDEVKADANYPKKK